MRRNIVIYKDEGVGKFGLQCLERFFKNDDVWLANAEAVIDGRVLRMADLFVMPGGADLPYCEKLNGAGNDNIRDYVKDGGTYLGICAGAYYACSRIEWEDGINPKKREMRELSLIEGTAIGIVPELIPFYIEDDLQSCSAAELQLIDDRNTLAFYHGGCLFDLPADHDYKILARYVTVPGQPPAIIEARFGEGRVILSGVHPEMSGELLEHFPLKDDKDRDCLNALARLISAHAPSPHDLLKDLLS